MENNSRSKSLWGAVAVVMGCAACCALPLLAGLGVAGMSGGVVAWLVSHEIVVGLGVAALVFIAGVFWKARRLRP